MSFGRPDLVDRVREVASELATNALRHGVRPGHSDSGGFFAVRPWTHRGTGGAEVMRAQLSRLVDASKADNIIVRVIPKSAGVHVGLDGPFMILTVDRQDIAYTDAIGGGRLVPPGKEVDRYKVWFEKIGAEALPQGPSRALIAELMERMT